MQTNANSYTFIYAAILTIISAILLALSSEGLKPAQDRNILLEKKKNVLNAVRFKYTEKTEIESNYDKYITALVVNCKGEKLENEKALDVVLKDEGKKPKEERKLPLYIYSGDDGKKYYIIPLYGLGLWGPIWGLLALDGNDFNTVYGSFFDHKGETPGLGAEIAFEPFQNQFTDKKIFDKNNQFVSVRVIKKIVKLNIENEQEHRVDAISGGTITSNGVDKMIREWVEQYIPYFNSINNQNAG